MSHHSGLRLLTSAAALATLAATIVPGRSFAATHTYGSDASSGIVAVTTGGNNYGGTLDPSGGTGSPSYAARNAVVNGTINVPLPAPLGVSPLTVTLKIPAAKTRANGHNVTGAGFEAKGRDLTRSDNLTLTAATPTGTVTLLQIQATRLYAEAQAVTSAAGVQTNGMHVTAGELKVAGTLIGTPITLKGPLTQSVIFTSPLVTITVAKTTTTMVAGLPKTAVTAVDVSFPGGSILGTTLGGGIQLSNASAY